MNPDEGDAGELGAVFDTITGTVNSIERFGNAVGGATSFSMTYAMIWAVIIFMFFTLLVRLGRSWSDAAAERYRTDRNVFTARPGRRRDPRDARIEELEDRVADLMAKIAELTGDQSPQLTEADHGRQNEMVG